MQLVPGRMPAGGLQARLLIFVKTMDGTSVERTLRRPVSSLKSIWEQIMDKDRITGTAKDWAGKAEGAVGDMAGDADTEAAGRVREAAGKVQNLYGQAKDAAREVADGAADFAKKAVQNTGDGSEALAKMVQDNPLGSLLTAGAVGFATSRAPTHVMSKRRSLLVAISLFSWVRTR